MIRPNARVRLVEDPSALGTVDQRYSGPKPAMRGMWQVTWDAGGQSWESASALALVNESVDSEVEPGR